MRGVLVNNVARKSMMFSNVTVDVTFLRIEINMVRVEGQNIKHEANSSIECFNDNDETVLQGETQYKYAE